MEAQSRESALLATAWLMVMSFCGASTVSPEGMRGSWSVMLSEGTLLGTLKRRSGNFLICYLPQRTGGSGWCPGFNSRTRSSHPLGHDSGFCSDRVLLVLKMLSWPLPVHCLQCPQLHPYHGWDHAPPVHDKGLLRQGQWADPDEDRNTLEGQIRWWNEVQHSSEKSGFAGKKINGKSTLELQ